MTQAFPTNDLSCWAKQGVFLINPVLTVREGASNSHKDKGWEEFTGSAIRKLWESDDKKVFVAWGAHARKFLANSIRGVANRAHIILEAGHPAAAAYGRDLFSHCGHFSKINEYHYINWRTYGANS